MAIILEAAYSKKLGLPNYSSHSYVVSLRTELNDINQVPEESSKLYKMLQQAVDREIQEVGFVPDATRYGMNKGAEANGNGHPRNGESRNSEPRNGEGSGISEKQLDLVNKIVNENNLNKSEIEDLAVQMFGNGVRSLNRLQGSNLISELFEKYGKRGNGRKPNWREREGAHDRRS